MELVPQDEIKAIAYYMPHHVVIKEQSTTTNVRVMFDASAIASSGKSLNEIKKIGPVVQADLFSLLIQW